MARIHVRVFSGHNAAEAVDATAAVIAEETAEDSAAGADGQMAARTGGIAEETAEVIGEVTAGADGLNGAAAEATDRTGDITAGTRHSADRN